MRVRVAAAMTVARELDAIYVWGAQTGGARRLGMTVNACELEAGQGAEVLQ